MGWWSATIMGGDTPLDYKSFIEEATGGLDKEALNSNIDAAVSMIEADKYDSHIGFQALGVLIMKVGADMSEELKAKIMDNSFDPELENWDDPKERKYYLDKFKDQISKYDGTPQEVEAEGLFEKIFKGIQ